MSATNPQFEPLLQQAAQAGYDRGGTMPGVGKQAFAEIARIGGEVVLAGLEARILDLAAHEEANWNEIRRIRATNERLCEALQRIASGTYTARR